jgi:hypothetical protein
MQLPAQYPMKIPACNARWLEGGIDGKPAPPGAGWINFFTLRGRLGARATTVRVRKLI